MLCLKYIFRKLRGPNADKDTEWSWVVAVSGFLINMCGCGLQNTFGLVFSSLLREFKESKAKTAFVGALTSSLMFGGAPVVCIIIDSIGTRKTTMIGSVLLAVSLIIASYSTSLEVMYASYGVMTGVATCLLATPSPQVINRYFDKKLQIGFAILQAGVPSSTFVFTPIYSYLIEIKGWRFAFRVMSVIFGLLTVIPGLTFAPTVKEIEDQETFRNVGISNKFEKYRQVLRSPACVVTIVALCLHCLASNIFETHLVEFAQSLQIPWREASMLPILLGAGSFTGRIVFAYFYSRKFVSTLRGYQLICIFAAVASVASAFTETFSGMAALGFIYGSGSGGTLGLQLVAIHSITGSKLFLQSIAFLYFGASVIMTIGPPCVGLLADATGDYRYLMYFTAVPYLLTASILLTVPYLKAPHLKDDDEHINGTSGEDISECHEKEQVPFIGRETSV